MSLIEHDLLVVLKSLLADTEIKNRANAFFNTNLMVDQGPALNKDVFKQLDTCVKIRSRDSYASFSIINCLKDPAELAEASRITSTFLAFKLSSELKNTSRTIHKKSNHTLIQHTNSQ